MLWLVLVDWEVELVEVDIELLVLLVEVLIDVEVD